MNGPRLTARELAAIAARWLLGALFIYMGLTKALHPDRFLKLINEYHLVGNPLLLNLIAAALPWFEVFCGILLLAGVAVQGTSLILLVLLFFFTWAVLRRALHIADAQSLPFSAIKFDCGCGNGVVLAWHKLIENSLLMALAAWLLADRGKRFCARFALVARLRSADIPVQCH